MAEQLKYIWRVIISRRDFYIDNHLATFLQLQQTFSTPNSTFLPFFQQLNSFEGSWPAVQNLIVTLWIIKIVY